MPTPSGTIKASDIAKEFGYSASNDRVSLGNYRISKTVSGMSNLALDNEYDGDGNIQKLVPQSGSISFGSLRGRRLNVVVDYGTTSGNRGGGNRYNNDIGVTIIGFKSWNNRPSNGAGAKIWLHTSGTVSSDGNSSSGRTYCSMLSGSVWDTSAELRIDITGAVVGAGGNGGNGGNSYNFDTPSDAGNGTDGTSAIGINASCPVIVSRRGNGNILGGGGGGGGGSGGVGANLPQKGHSWQGNQYSVSGGGGGGGGMGIPGGGGGSGGTASHNGRGSDWPGSKGVDGTTSKGGDGGSGGSGGCNACEGNSYAGAGGGGGFWGANGGAGSSNAGGSAGEQGGTGKKGKNGNGGSAGYAIVTKNSSVDVRGSGGYYGGTLTNKEPS
jgi:hypothetical protein